MRFRPKSAGTLQFIFIAVVLMLLADHFLFSGKRSYIEDAKRGYSSEARPWDNPDRPPPVRVEPEDGKAFFEAPPMEEPGITQAPDTPDTSPDSPAPPAEEPEKPPAKPVTSEPEPAAPDQAPAKTLAPKIEKRSDIPSGKAGHPVIRGLPKIAVIIDDVGMDVKHSRLAIDLPAPVTLAFLPYAPKTPKLAAIAKDKGHELIIHTPMEAMDAHLNIGPGGLKSGMSAEEFDKAFGVMMDSFKGYDGINNHMGSRLTQDKQAMAHLMKILKRHDLFFVDSKTIGTSVAAQEASAAGLPFAERDVFLDHVETIDFARGALKKAERIAQRQGYAIVIGHPKSFTLQALQEWIPTLKEKGIELVPVKSILTRPPVGTAAVPPQAPEHAAQ